MNKKDILLLTLSIFGCNGVAILIFDWLFINPEMTAVQHFLQFWWAYFLCVIPTYMFCVRSKR